MAGSNPAAATVTFGAGAAGWWQFTSANPTHPVLKVNVTAPGTITDLRIKGKSFSSADYLQAQNATDATSIAKYGTRQISISNSYIAGTGIAGTIANAIVANSKDPISYIPSITIRFTPSLQIGDRVIISDNNLDMTENYIVSGLTHKISGGQGEPQVDTNMALIRVPAGS